MTNRSYKAARRRAKRESIGFDYRYDVEVVEGEETRWEERSEHFDCTGQVNTLLLSELAANSDVDTATPEGMGLIRHFFAQALGARYHVVKDDEGNEREELVDDDAAKAYRRFFKLHTRYGDDDLLMDIMGGLVEDFQADPSGSPSSLPDGPSESGGSSKVVSLSRGTVEFVPGEVLAEEPEQTSGSASSG
jgi:hypothetical protein